MEDNSLKHYGVRGMRWGVRRYQNYDGTYTQKGMQRYKKADSEYRVQKSKVEALKDRYKSSGGAAKESLKGELLTEKQNLKGSKRKLDQAYKDLRLANRADKGKDLYRRGNTITMNQSKRLVTAKVAGTGASVGAIALEYLKNSGVMDRRIATISQASIAAGAALVTGLVYGSTLSQDKKMREYVYKKV